MSKKSQGPLVMLVQSWRKLLPDLQNEDLQGFHSKQISISEILDTVVYYDQFWNLRAGEWLQGKQMVLLNEY
jgi:hypothetical protein